MAALELACQAIKAVKFIYDRYKEMKDVDKTCEKCASELNRLRCVLEQGQESRAFDACSPAMKEHLTEVCECVEQFKIFLNGYDQEGKKKGWFARMVDFCKTGANKDELLSLSDRLDHAIRGLNLSGTLDIHAGISQVLVQQGLIANTLGDLVSKHQGADVLSDRCVMDAPETNFSCDHLPSNLLC